MKISIFLVILCIIFAAKSSKEAPLSSDRPSHTTEEPESSQDYESDEGEDIDAMLIGLDIDVKSNLAVVLSQDHTRDEMHKILQRTLDILDNKPLAERERRHPTHNSTARALGRVLLADPHFAMQIDEETCSPARKKARTDSDNEYCEIEPSAHGQMSVTSMKKILELRDKGRSHSAIEKIYPRYRRDKIPFYREQVQKIAPYTTALKSLNDKVIQTIAEARQAGRPVHGYNLRRWGLGCSSERGGGIS